MSKNDDEMPSPTPDEMAAKMRRIFGEERKPAKKAKIEEKVEDKAAEAEKPTAYKTRQAKAD